MYLSGKLTVVVIIIDLTAQLVESIDAPQEVQFTMTAVHPAVRTTVMLFDRHILQGIRIVVLCVYVLRYRTECETVGEILLITDERTDITERAELHLSSQMRLHILCGHSQGLDIQHGRSGCLTGRQKDIVMITDDQREVLNIIQGVTGEVYLPTLTFREHHTIIAHPCMLGSKAMYGNRLHSPCPTIVTQGDTRHTVHGISNIRHPHRPHVLTV